MTDTPGPPAHLASPDWLAAAGDGDVVVLELAAEPDQEAYAAGHVPGARFVYWEDFCWHETDRRFPSGDELRRRLRRFGVGDASTVVVYGDPIQYGTYAYWALTTTRAHPQILLLDGGKRGWAASGRALATGRDEAGDAPAPVPAPEPAGADRAVPGCVATRDEVLAVVEGDRVGMLIDARSPEEYAGTRVSPTDFEVDHGAQRKGRIPGAVHLPYERLLRDDERFRPPEEIEGLLAEAGVDPAKPAITYCRLSHRASLVWFALTRLLGRTDVRVYDGSWTEWGSMVGMPVER